jgi:transforming growth factor-beta-induced protein
MPNQNASNGVIHVIDRVMFPLPLEPLTGLVTKDPMLSTLLTAVKAAGLVDTLSGKHTLSVKLGIDYLSLCI